MGIFDHHHYWRPITGTNTVINENGQTVKSLLLQGCGCGAVRTIELAPGEPPVIRNGTTAPDMRVKS